MDPQDIKRDLIIEAALKRFAHFGLQKTTMNEIAKDLNLSKALLYYYFPDKISLYTAVLKKIFSTISSAVDSYIQTCESPEEALSFYFKEKQIALEKYFTLLDFGKLSNNEKYLGLKKILEESNQNEINHFKCIIEIGVKAKLYEVKNIHDTAILLFEASKGLLVYNINKTNNFFGIDIEFLASITKKQKELAKTFLKGLS